MKSEVLLALHESVAKALNTQPLKEGEYWKIEGYETILTRGCYEIDPHERKVPFEFTIRKLNES